MSESTPQKPLARQRFLALVGVSAFGLWLSQLLPSGMPLVKLPQRRPKPSVSSRLASRIKVHPLAVEREHPVRRES